MLSLAVLTLGDVLVDDDANRCMLHHEGSGAVLELPHQVGRRWRVCQDHGWQGVSGDTAGSNRALA